MDESALLIARFESESARGRRSAGFLDAGNHIHLITRAQGIASNFLAPILETIIEISFYTDFLFLGQELTLLTPTFDPYYYTYYFTTIYYLFYYYFRSIRSIKNIRSIKTGKRATDR